MLFVYNLLIRLVAFVSFVAKQSKIKTDAQWQGRFAQIESLATVDLWIHAASVGEVKVIGHLIHYLISQKEEIKIHLTTMTKTGYELACELYKSDNLAVTQFPFDTKALMVKTFDIIKPKLLVIAETEIWPNCILEAEKRKVPIVLVNGRMSSKAFKRYTLLQKSFSYLLKKYNKLFVKSSEDAMRFLTFANENQIQVAGDMKFDAPLIERTKEKVDGIRIACGIEFDSYILVAGSTRPGEEEMLADLFLKMIKVHKAFNLIIAPRHIERVDEIKTILQKKNIQFKLYGSSSKHESVILVDKVGLLQNLYLAADLTFVGGTLVGIGGHNLLEPVWAGVPVMFGDSIYNVNESAEYIMNNNYGMQVGNSSELIQKVQSHIVGDLQFATKSSNDLENSATRDIGDNLLELLTHV